MSDLRPGTEHNWVTAIGEDLEFDCDIVDANGTPVDLTDAGYQADIRRHKTDTEAAAELTVTPTDAETATVNLLLDDVSLDVGVYYYDLHVKLAEVDEQRVDGYPIWGTITVVAAVTPSVAEPEE